MRDRLDIRKELSWAVAIWSFFDFFQYIFYYFTQLANCPPASPTLYFLTEYAPLFSYVIIIMRDFATHCVMVYFIVRVNRRESNIKNELERDDSPHDLQELKTVLNSCRPLMVFSGYLDEKKPDHLRLLEYIKVYETIKELEIELNDLESRKQEAEEKLQDLYSSSAGR